MVLQQKQHKSRGQFYLEQPEYREKFLKSEATGCGSISTVFSSIVLLCVTSIIIIIRESPMLIPTFAKGLFQLLQWPMCTCLNWLVRMGCYTVWRDKSPKATVTTFIIQIQVAGLSYWLPQLVACAVQTLTASWRNMW